MSTRRNFLVGGVALPVIASATRTASPDPQPAAPPSSKPVFQYRVLGKTGLKVTTVGFGCMITSDGSVVERAADLGITYFDTARGYQSGNNERMVGAALKKKRNDIILSSKTNYKTKEEALAHIDTSLKELGTDHLDIWYLHNKTKPEDIKDELIEAQQIAKKAGKIRFAGVSTHAGQAELIPFLAKHPQVDVILTAYNFTLEPAVAAAMKQASEAGKGIVAMKVMAGGFRSIKPTDPNYAKLKRDGGLLAALKREQTSLDTQLELRHLIMQSLYAQKGLARTRARLQSELTNLPSAVSHKIGRNDPCPCGSGRKYKHCCLNKPRA